MRILITGAAGFIGSHLAEQLLRQGHQVTGVDCFSDYYSPALKEHTARRLSSQGAQIIRKNLAHDDFSAALAGTEVIFHLAAQPGNSSTISFQSYAENNISATQRLLAACSALDSLQVFINIATSSVYGYYATSPETAAPEPVSYYGVTKLAAEQLVLARQRNSAFPACSLRLFSVYGERERPDKLIPQLVKAIVCQRGFPLYEGSTEHLRSFTYVGDIVAGLTAVLDHWPQVNGEIFNIGSDSQTTTGAVISLVEGLMGQSAKKELLPARLGDQVATHADISKARRLLGYQPKVLPAEGIERFIHWFRGEIFERVEY